MARSRPTWFLRKATASVVGTLFGLPCLIAPLSRVGLQCRGQPWTPPLWQRGFFLVNCFCVATLFAFGEKRCRKNLPLAAPIRAVTSKNHQCPECHGHDVIALVYKNRKLRTMFSDDWNATVGRRIVTDNAEFAKNKDGSPKHRGDAKYRCRTCNHEW